LENVVYVRPILEYVSILWNPHQLNSIEKVQNNFLRKLNYTFKNPADSEFSSREKLGVVSLAQRRQYLDVTFVYNLLNNNIEDAV
jgi:hypothetical protein